MPKSKAVRRGPKPKPPEMLSRMASTKLAPPVWEWVAAVGDGSVTRGLRKVVGAAFEQKTLVFQPENLPEKNSGKK